MTRQQAKEITLKVVKPYRGHFFDALSVVALAIQSEYARQMEERLQGFLLDILRQHTDCRVMRVHDEFLVEMPVPPNDVRIDALVTQYGAIIQAPQSVPLIKSA